MTNKIKHKGVVDTIDGRCVRVRILQTSACSTCKVSGHCNASESKEKIVDVFGVSPSRNLSVGDEVVVSTSMSAARKALVVGFGLPFLVLVIALFIALGATGDETVSAVVALLSLIPYYIIVYMLRDRIGGNVAFEIE